MRLACAWADRSVERLDQDDADGHAANTGKQYPELSVRDAVHASGTCRDCRLDRSKSAAVLDGAVVCAAGQLERHYIHRASYRLSRVARPTHTSQRDVDPLRSGEPVRCPEVFHSD